MLGHSEDETPVDDFDFDLYTNAASRPKHIFMVAWSTWTEGEGIAFRQEHRLPHFHPSAGSPHGRHGSAFKPPRATPDKHAQWGMGPGTPMRPMQVPAGGGEAEEDEEMFGDADLDAERDGDEEGDEVEA